MGTTKHRKNHKSKVQARKQQMLAKRKHVDSLVEELKTEMAKLSNPNNEPVAVLTNETGRTILTPTPIEFDI